MYQEDMLQEYEAPNVQASILFFAFSSPSLVIILGASSCNAASILGFFSPSWGSYTRRVGLYRAMAARLHTYYGVNTCKFRVDYYKRMRA